jgi:hypothetical protein
MSLMSTIILYFELNYELGTPLEFIKKALVVKRQAEDAADEDGTGWGGVGGVGLHSSHSAPIAAAPGGHDALLLAGAVYAACVR